MKGHGLLTTAAWPTTGGVVDVAVRDECPLPARTDLVNTREIWVTPPAVNGGSAPTVGVGTDVTVEWDSPTGRYQVHTWLAEVTSGPHEHWVLSVLEQPGRVERRTSVRVPVHFDVEMRADGRAWRGSAVDLSEGGIRIVSERGPTPPAGKVACAFDVGHPVHTAASVLRVAPFGRDHVEVALEFIAVSDLEPLRAFVAEQRQHRG